MSEFGDTNGHLIGIAMKEMVRRALIRTRAQRIISESTPHAGSPGKMHDFITDAELIAQTIYLRSISECFTNFGVVAVEEGISFAGKENYAHLYFTVNAIDGKEAFTGRRSESIGTMISLVSRNNVIAACVGDIRTGEVYFYGPSSKNVYRVSEFEASEPLVSKVGNLNEKYLLLRNIPEEHSASARDIIANAASKASFNGYRIEVGSIGMAMAKLWKGEAGGVILPPSIDHPWDWQPVVGISKRLKFRFIRIGELGETELFEPTIQSQSRKRDFEVLIVHQYSIPRFLNHR